MGRMISSGSQQLSKPADGTYQAIINLQDHNFDAGHYSVHVYGQSRLGDQFLCLAGTEGFTVKENQVVFTQPEAKVINYQKEQGTLEVQVSETVTSKVIKQVRVAAWSEKNQENLHWYSTTELKEDRAVLKVDTFYQQFKSGNYTIHTYLDYSDATTSDFNLGQWQLTAHKTPLTEILSLAESYKGILTGSQAHKNLVNTYNSIRPLPVGYTVKYDDWCDVFVSTIFIKSGLSHLIDRECGVQCHINLMSDKRIWLGKISTPKAGDIVTFDWDDNRFADHIGIENGKIRTIKGNTTMPGRDIRGVNTKSYDINSQYIKGFARPKY
ncbi:GBS Bsp-like repeat-containing protein [Streptococcus sp. HF-1907]|uniref:GBS Bsp-like repeat-containing protein n=1 Tax=Streptococcus sp. HF-1907 TaxID=2785793 RepID=UPI0018A0BB5A|nr:GBS Bsp-like repeat-containing protein [Streptococcus sp. HF-1907]MBF7095447.1 GBS Bsp-like repeat-containing protein [Streptococcus sp. HF-1907]